MTDGWPPEIYTALQQLLSNMLPYLSPKVQFILSTSINKCRRHLDAYPGIEYWFHAPTFLDLMLSDTKTPWSKYTPSDGLEAVPHVIFTHDTPLYYDIPNFEKYLKRRMQYDRGELLLEPALPFWTESKKRAIWSMSMRKDHNDRWVDGLWTRPIHYIRRNDED
jgi:hypothetical protein